jgi:hypothetical protein
MSIKIKLRIRIIFSTLLSLLMTLVYFSTGFVILNLIIRFQALRSTVFIYSSAIFTKLLLFFLESSRIDGIAFLVIIYSLFFLLAYRLLKKYDR